jgi:hypothetical protein
VRRSSKLFISVSPVVNANKLESLGYPVKLKVADELMNILHKRDLASEILKQLNGKPNAKNIKKILSRDYSYLELDKDPDLKTLYEKLKTKHEAASKITEKMSSLIEQKNDPAEFGKMIKLIEENNLYVEKVIITQSAYHK